MSECQDAKEEEIDGQKKINIFFGKNLKQMEKLKKICPNCA